MLDPFCGCGTAIAVAERLKRRWVGIDVTHLALNMVRERMKGAAFEVHGEPVDLRRGPAPRGGGPVPVPVVAPRSRRRPARRAQGEDADEPHVDGELFFSNARPGLAGPARRSSA